MRLSSVAALQSDREQVLPSYWYCYYTLHTCHLLPSRGPDCGTLNRLCHHIFLSILLSRALLRLLYGDIGFVYPACL